MGIEHKFGFVACLGRTNVGKSTLINRLLGQKLAIVSHKPQTTRRSIRGILNLPAAQIVLVDTPGLHLGRKLIDKGFIREARGAVENADIVLAITDPTVRHRIDEEKMLTDIIKSSSRPAVLALNKIDLLEKQQTGDLLRRFEEEGIYRSVIGVSARTGRNLPELTEAVTDLLTAAPALYPSDIISDQPEREIFAEIVREKVFRNLHQELPYSAAVLIEEVTEEKGGALYRIHATIYVERESQKGMLIGKGGQSLKRIGEASRRDIEKLTGAKVFLRLWVKVRKNWTKEKSSLREFGFE